MKPALQSLPGGNVLTAAIFRKYGEDLYLFYDGTQSVKLLEDFFDQAQHRLHGPKSVLRLDDIEIFDRAAYILNAQYILQGNESPSEVERVTSIDVILHPVSGGQPVRFSPAGGLDTEALKTHLRDCGYLDGVSAPTEKCNDGRLSDVFKGFAGFPDEDIECRAYEQLCSGFDITDALEISASGAFEIHSTPAHLRTLKDIICLNYCEKRSWEGQEMADGGYGEKSYAFRTRVRTAPGNRAIEALKLLMVGAELDSQMVRQRFLTEPFYFDV